MPTGMKNGMGGGKKRKKKALLYMEKNINIISNLNAFSGLISGCCLLCCDIMGCINLINVI